MSQSLGSMSMDSTSHGEKLLWEKFAPLLNIPIISQTMKMAGLSTAREQRQCLFQGATGSQVPPAFSLSMVGAK